MIESETTASLTDAEIRRARFWIQRWRAIGGGILVKESGEVEVGRVANANPKLEKHYSQAEGELLKEINKDRKKADTVAALARIAAAQLCAGAADTIQDNEPESQPEPPAAA